MMLNRKSSQSRRSAWTMLRAGVAGLGVALGGAAVTVGCLDRPVTPATPKTSNVYVDEIRQTAVDKIDLLFMIDNSVSMADKQKILGRAVPILVNRLITPICVKACEGANCSAAQIRDGVPTGANSVDGKCAGGGSPEFQPIKDIHVGIVTSSLGSHGAAAGPDSVCTDTAGDDHAHLIGQIRPDKVPVETTWNSTGFLKWDAGQKYQPPGDNDGGTFGTKFTTMVTASGEKGCGFEASLESWYRFLIDPEPPLAVAVPAGEQVAQIQGVDETVLAQRAAFLREDSLVAVIMLSDENDCSIQDEGYGWLLARQKDAMFRSTSACATDPNSACCQSCAETMANDGCGLPSADAACQAGTKLDSKKFEDPMNLRCWDQKRRFGFDLLYPISRYADGLRSPTLPKRSNGELVTNPLFTSTNGKPPREKGLVFLAGLVGVPWQDIADDASLNGEGLRYKTATEMLSDDTWKNILGDPTASPPVKPADPFMHETPDERTGMNPVTGDAIVNSMSDDPQANPINGHEQKNIENQDLQYACTFELEEPVDCTDAKFMAQDGCDCFQEDIDYGFNRPLCQPKGGGAPTIKQTYAKAYPGIRHLQTLKEFGANSIVASICPKYPTGDTNATDYGYNPAVKAIIDRLKDALKGKCLPRPLVPKPESKADLMDGLQVNQVPCKVVEATVPQSPGACGCNEAERRAEIVNPALRTAILTKLYQNGTCDTGSVDSPRCEDFCTCELKQLEGAELTECQQNSAAPEVPGYCYINAAPNEPNVGNPDLVKSCTADSKRLLRFVGGTPSAGAIALVACLGASLGTTAE